MTKRYTANETTALAQKWYNDKTTKNEAAVVIAMERLISWQVGLRYRLIASNRIMRSDLMQEARMGVLKALQKYDGERSFTSYASYWTQQFMNKYVNAEIHMVKYKSTPAHLHIRYKYNKFMDQTYSAHGPVSVQEAHKIISEKEGIPVDVLEEYVSKGTAYVSISPREIDDSRDGSSLEMQLTDDVDIENTVCSEIDKRKCLKIIESFSHGLTDRETDIFNNYILGGTDDTQVTLAEKYGVTRQRIQQIEKELRSSVIFDARIALGLD